MLHLTLILWEYYRTIVVFCGQCERCIRNKNLVIISVGPPPTGGAIEVQCYVNPVAGCLLDVSLRRCFGHAHPGGDPGADLGHTTEIISLGWPGNVSVSPRRSWWTWRGVSGFPCLNCCPRDLDPDKRLKMRRNKTSSPSVDLWPRRWVSGGAILKKKL